MAFDSNQPDDINELLSAYLDGELTADEQSLIEQRLAENAGFRQLHDELRALRTGLEGLPRYKLDQDLAATVLRRAERAMLSTPAVAQPVVDSQNGQVARADSATDFQRSGRGIHRFRWSIVAVAVAIAIMIFNPPTKNGDEKVAQTLPRGEALEAARSGGPEDNLAAESHADEKAAMKYDLRALANDESQPAPAAAAESFAHPKDANQATEEKQAKMARRANGVADAKLESINAAEGTVPGADISGGGSGGKGAAESEAIMPGKFGTVRKQLQSEGLRKSARERDMRPEAKLGGQDRQNRLGVAAEPQSDQELFGDSAKEDVVVIRFNITAEAAQSGAFEKLLSEQQIALANDRALRYDFKRIEIDAKPADGIRDNGKDVPETNGTAGLKEQSELPANKKETIEHPLADGDLQASRTGMDSLDGYLVEASPQQIEATLAGLQGRQNEFSGVVIDPAAPPAQQRQTSVEGAGVSSGRGLAQRVIVDAEQPSAPAAARYAREELKRNIEGEDRRDKGEKADVFRAGGSADPQSLPLSAGRAKMKAAEAPAAPPPAGDIAAPAIAAKPRSEAARLEVAKKSGDGAAAGEPQVPAMRVLFLYRVVPSPAESR